MKTNMKAIALCAALAALSAAPACAEELDGIAAQVGDTTILRSEVTRRMRPFGLPVDTDFNKVLNQVIDEKLIVKAAANAKMTMQEWVVDNRIREVVEKSFGGDRNKLIEALAAEKLPFSEFRQRIKNDLIVTAMRWNAVDKYVTASPSEMLAEYKAHPERYMRPATADVSIILVKTDVERAAVDEALKTEAFGDVARKYSSEAHARDGGVWKDVRPGETFLKEVSDEIERLKPGETSAWIELGGWSFLVRKDGETPAAPRTFAEAYEDVEETCKTAKASELYRRWIDLLKADTYIKVY